MNYIIKYPYLLDNIKEKDNIFLERETSWLAFNERVLELALNKHIPLLERINFISIFFQNLDEFFMTRVSYLKRKIETDIPTKTPYYIDPLSVLETISSITKRLTYIAYKTFYHTLAPQLKHITIKKISELHSSEIIKINNYFHKNVFTLLTPLLVDTYHPFPYISNKSLNIAAIVQNPTNNLDEFTRIKIPETLPRFVKISQNTYITIEDIIFHNLQSLFPGMHILDKNIFRVTRYEDIELDEETEDIIQSLEVNLLKRKFGTPVRLEIKRSNNDKIISILTEELKLNDIDIYKTIGMINLGDINKIYNRGNNLMKFQKFTPRSMYFIKKESNIFSHIKENDILLHHPYDSFSGTVQSFLDAAVNDKNVLAIKQTLYRTSKESPIIESLINGAINNKQIMTLIEVKAKFDEYSNMNLARTLEKNGCHVVYGVSGLKTHCKMILITRNENNKLVQYAHIGTGNYNHDTARIYEDIGILTANKNICHDLTNLFNFLSGYSLHKNYKSLLVAPYSLKTTLIQKIKRLINKNTGEIYLKINSLTDETIINELYNASNHNIKIYILVRGICIMKNMNKNIFIKSIVGRFLEHSRIFIFNDYTNTEIFISSADLMHNKLHNRIEIATPIQNKKDKDYILNLMYTAMDNNTIGWRLNHDGSWEKTIDYNNQKCQDLHNILIKK